MSATFSPDGSRVLTTSNDGTARIWHVNEQIRSLILRPEEHAYEFRASFLPEGSGVVTLNQDGLIRIYPLEHRPV